MSLRVLNKGLGLTDKKFRLKLMKSRTSSLFRYNEEPGMTPKLREPKDSFYPRDRVIDDTGV